MYHLICLHGSYLKEYGQYWTSWTSNESEAAIFWDKLQARELAAKMEADLAPRVALS